MSSSSAASLVLPSQPRHCPTCGHIEVKWIMCENGFDILQCRACRLLFVWPRPDEKSLSRFYAQKYSLTPEAIECRKSLQPMAYSNEVRRILDRISGGGRLLDVGCSYGFFLDKMRANGYETWGLDLDPNAVRYAVEVLGLKRTQLAFLEDAAFPNDMFDVVTLFMTLEHLLDPARDLREVWRVLRPGGLICTTVPNIFPLRVKFMRFLDGRGRWLRPILIKLRVLGSGGLLGPGRALLDPPNHLQGFSASSLRFLLEESGFCDVTIFSHIPIHGNPKMRLARGYLFGLTSLLGGLNGQYLISPAITALAHTAPS